MKNMKNMKNKTYSILRIVLSGVALLAFVLLSLYNIFSYTPFNTYGWRSQLLKYLFLLVPFAALFAFSIMERKLKNINGRTYITGLFGIYLLQVIAVISLGGTSEFTFFCCSTINRISEIVIFIAIIRAVMLVIVPIANKLLLKIYSLGMTAFLILMLILNLSSEYFIMGIGFEMAFAMTVDILFHVALFFFNNLMDNDNKSKLWSAFFGISPKSPFEDAFSDDDEDEDDEYIESDKRLAFPRPSYADQYKLLFIDALNSEDEKFLKTNEFLRDLTYGKVLGKDGHVYTRDEFAFHIKVVAEQAEKLQLKKPDLVSERFVNLINALIEEKDSEDFKADVINVAKTLLADRQPWWNIEKNPYSDIFDD